MKRVDGCGMLKITKGDIKPIFFDIKKKYSVYDELREKEKDEIKKILIKEQHYRCVYCMCRIDLASTSIEHYIPQSKDPAASLDYRNMFAVCNITKDKPREHQTCDAHRGNVPLRINPLKQNDIDTIQYTHSGKISSVNEDFKYDITDTLHLNDERLKNNRKAALQSLANRSNRNKNKEWGKDKIKKFLSVLYSPDNDTPYAGFLIYMLERRLERA